MKIVGFLRVWSLVAMLQSAAEASQSTQLNVSQHDSSIARPLIKPPGRHTWWIDDSCKAVPGFATAFNEVRAMACSGARRLGKDSDTDFERVFAYTFKAPRDSAEKYARSQAWRRRHRDAKTRTPRENVRCKFGCPPT